MTPELDTRSCLDTLDGLTARRAYFSYGLVLLLWRLDVRPGLDRHPHRPPRSRRDRAVEEKASMLRSRGRSHIGSDRRDCRGEQRQSRGDLGLLSRLRSPGHLARLPLRQIGARPPGSRSRWTLLAVLVLVGAGAAFRVNGQPLDGLAATAHHHHGLVITALLVPLLIISLACLRLPKTRPVELEIVPDSRESHPSGSVLIRRRNLIGAGAFLLALVWLAGTNNLGLLIGLGVLLAGSAVFLWRKNRVDMRSVLGDLRPPTKP